MPFSRARHFAHTTDKRSRANSARARARARTGLFPFPRAHKNASLRPRGHVDYISPEDNIPVGACWGSKVGMQRARGLTSFSAVRRINKRRRTSRGPRFRRPPSRRRSFVLANRTRVPARPFRKNARNVQSYNARPIGLSFWIPFLSPFVLFSARCTPYTFSRSLLSQHSAFFFSSFHRRLFPLDFVPPADFRDESKKSSVIAPAGH